MFQALGRACRGSVFEFGCGDGRLSPAFEPDQYAGFDINPAALAAAETANPGHRYVRDWEPAETWLAHTVLLHVADDEIGAVIERAKQYPRVVIGEVMGRRWRRSGNPPVFNREASEYVDMMGRPAETVLLPYPRYGCNLTLLVFG